jgi:hypothetical protein
MRHLNQLEKEKYFYNGQLWSCRRLKEIEGTNGCRVFLRGLRRGSNGVRLPMKMSLVVSNISSFRYVLTLLCHDYY